MMPKFIKWYLIIGSVICLLLFVLFLCNIIGDVVW